MGVIVERMKNSFSGETTYEKVKQALASGSVAKREALARRADTRPEVLYFLARDESPDVRNALATNSATPAQADQVLADDPDEEVRRALARKIATIAPGLGPAETDRARSLAFDTLKQLAQDQAARVREMLAEELKADPSIAPEIIQRLATDDEISVAAPVLEFSPVLTDEDLLSIISRGIDSRALSAISRRTEVNSDVSDAIVATDDEAAIASLLGNAKAQIREETLDRLSDIGAERISWHAPIVKRPALSGKAISRLARYVARNMVETLAARHDIDPATAAKVSETLDRRISEGDPYLEPARTVKDGSEREQPLEKARRALKNAASPDEAMTQMLEARDHGQVIAAIAILNKVDIEHVRKAFARHTAKAVVALCWRAGLSAGTAGKIQYRVAKIPPSAVIHAAADGSYALTEDELTWQVDLFLST
ncbi:MAG: DUF2336 domain-containing protein [Rhodospirillales bacterium]